MDINILKMNNNVGKLLCFFGLHKWNFGSTIIETKKEDINFCLPDYKIGEKKEYNYKCERCGFERIWIVSYSYFHHTERWKRKNEI